MLHYLTNTLHITHSTLRYITLHYITLHYITLHYITLHYTFHFMSFHFITITLQITQSTFHIPHCTLHIPRCTLQITRYTFHVTLNYSALHYVTYIRVHTYAPSRMSIMMAMCGSNIGAIQRPRDLSYALQLSLPAAPLGGKRSLLLLKDPLIYRNSHITLTRINSKPRFSQPF